MRQSQRLVINSDDKGFVAFFVTIMVMIILGILILSFSLISDREVASATNRVLSTQALYAAESGINDAYSNIVNNNYVAVPQTQHCAQDDNGGNFYNNSLPSYINNSSGSQYTCVYVNPTPKSVTFNCNTTGVCPNSSFTASFTSSTTNDLFINWDSPAPGSVLTGCPSSVGNFLPFGRWSSDCTSVLRVDLVPFAPRETTTELENGVKTFFLYPLDNSVVSSQIAWGGLQSNSYPVEGVNCTINTRCSYEITGLNPSLYYIRVIYYYTVPNITLSCNGLDLGTSCSLQDSAYQIDVTGYSSGVEKRISADIQNNATLGAQLLTPPNFAIQSTHSICKSLIINSATDLSST